MRIRIEHSPKSSRSRRRTTKRVIALLFVLAAIVGTVAACTSDGKTNDQKSAIKTNKSFTAPVIKNYIDYHNFYKAQELYDDPTTIQWCTFTWGNANSPLVTVPIAGKLTSSTVSLRPTTQSEKGSDNGTYSPELPSTDSMYHGSPPPYRYGFTPGGQYVDFNSSVPTFCTTALTKFQRQKTQVDLTNDPSMLAAQQKAQQDLAKCNADLKAKTGPSKSCQAAQTDLQGGLGG